VIAASKAASSVSSAVPTSASSAGSPAVLFGVIASWIATACPAASVTVLGS
jgi:hypothetical protein